MKATFLAIGPADILAAPARTSENVDDILHVASVNPEPEAREVLVPNEIWPAGLDAVDDPLREPHLHSV